MNSPPKQEMGSWYQVPLLEIGSRLFSDKIQKILCQGVDRVFPYKGKKGGKENRLIKVDDKEMCSLNKEDTVELR